MRSFFLLPQNAKEGYERIGNITIYRKDFLTIPYRKRFGFRSVDEALLLFLEILHSLPPRLST